MARPRERTAAERRRILGELERSGLTVREFARRCGIPAGTLGYWRYIERRRGRRPVGPRRRAAKVELIELTPVRAQERAEAFELALGRGRVLRIPAGFEAEALGRLLAVLERPC